MLEGAEARAEGAKAMKFLEEHGVDALMADQEARKKARSGQVTDEVLKGAFDQATLRHYPLPQERDKDIVLRIKERGVGLYLRYMGSTWGSRAKNLRAFRSRAVMGASNAFEMKNRVYHELFTEDPDERAARRAESEEG